MKQKKMLSLMALCCAALLIAEESPQGKGLAAGYAQDRGIEQHAAVLFASNFEGEHWRRGWTGRDRENVITVKRDPERRFVPLKGAALRVQVPKGEHYGASLKYLFQQEQGSEPEEIYFRYYLRLAHDWNPEKNGKLPGIAGTYQRGGWGGRSSNGKNGWSARGTFRGQQDGKTATGFYCYHADMPGKYGEAWLWQEGGLGDLENNRWYCIEQYLKLNSPGKNDGVLRGWVDGKLAFERKGVRFRDTEKLKIECVWLNIYHGGKWTAPSEDSLYIDNVVISKAYIGPMKP